MDEKVTFYILIIIGAIGVFFGLSFMFPDNGFAGTFSGGSGLSANVLSVVGSNQSEAGVLYMSYDNLQNVHAIEIQDATGIRVNNVRSQDNFQTLFAGTTKGLYVSRNGGLNWDAIRIEGKKYSLSEPDELSTSTIVLDIIPLSTKDGGGYLMSAFNAGRGYIYKTENNFSSLEKIIDFKQEVAYAMYVYGGNLYVGMSNGQLLRYDLSKKTLETLDTFSQPITNIYYASDNFFYITLKNGTLYRSASPHQTFEKVRLPGGGLFSSASAIQFTYDEKGNIYIRTKSGIYRSRNSGVSFTKYTGIPLLENEIDSFGVHQGTLYILSGGRLYTSSYAGDEWKVKEIAYPKPIRDVFFIGGGKVVITQ